MDRWLADQHFGCVSLLSMLSAGNLAPDSLIYPVLPFSVIVNGLWLFSLLCFKYIYSISNRKAVIKTVPRSMLGSWHWWPCIEDKRLVSQSVVYLCNTSMIYCKIWVAVTSYPRIAPYNEDVRGKLNHIFLLAGFSNYIRLPFLTSLHCVGTFHCSVASSSRSVWACRSKEVSKLFICWLEGPPPQKET